MNRPELEENVPPFRLNGLTYQENLVHEPGALFETLRTEVEWDERMTARKTASFGVAYNYSQIQYPHQPFSQSLQEMATALSQLLGFAPNNCLINYYLDGKSKMGFHSDQTDILAKGTGVAIISLGATRTLQFRNIANKELVQDISLNAGSLLYMSQEVQHHWQHAIPKSDTSDGRMSLTFRQLIS